MVVALGWRPWLLWRISVGFVAVCLSLSLATPIGAREFRERNPIPVPAETGEAEEQISPESFEPVDPERVEEAVKEIYDAYNTPELAEHLADDFYDGQRLVDSIDAQVPRDARMRVLAIQAPQTLSQRREQGPGGDVLVSTISVSVRAQLEYSDPQHGFQRLEGQSELVIRIREAAEP